MKEETRKKTIVCVITIMMEKNAVDTKGKTMHESLLYEPQKVLLPTFFSLQSLFYTVYDNGDRNDKMIMRTRNLRHPR